MEEPKENTKKLICVYYSSITVAKKHFLCITVFFMSVIHKISNVITWAFLSSPAYK